MRTKQAVKILNALAQDNRIDIFKLLVRQGKTGMSAGNIAIELDLPPSTLSFHLSHMSNVELIYPERSGRVLTYFANLEMIQQLVGYLLERCCEAQESKESEDCTTILNACLPAEPEFHDKKEETGNTSSGSGSGSGSGCC